MVDAAEPDVNVANALSLLRVLLAALLWFRPASWAWVTGVMGVAAVSDIADGWAARRFGPAGAPECRVGAWLDPVCDKIFMLSLAAAVYVVHRPAWWLVALVLARDFLVTLLLGIRLLVPLAARGVDYRARPLGKATTATQYAAVVLLLLAPAYFEWAAWLAAALGVGAGIDYVRRVTER